MPDNKFDEVKIEVAGLEKAFDLFFNGPMKNKAGEADKASSGFNLGRGMLKFAKLPIKNLSKLQKRCVVMEQRIFV